MSTYCLQCGAPQRIENKFCRSCGRQIDETEKFQIEEETSSAQSRLGPSAIVAALTVALAAGGYFLWKDGPNDALNQSEASPVAVEPGSASIASNSVPAPLEGSYDHPEEENTTSLADNNATPYTLTGTEDVIILDSANVTEASVASVYPQSIGNSLVVAGWGDYFYALYAFEIDQIPDNFSKVKIALFASNTPSENWSYPEMSLWKIDSQWSSDVVWNNQPKASYVRNVGKPDSVGWFYIDISDLVREWKRGNNPNFGFQLRPNTNHANRLDFDRTSSPDIGRRPRLIIEQ